MEVIVIDVQDADAEWWRVEAKTSCQGNYCFGINKKSANGVKPRPNDKITLYFKEEFGSEIVRMDLNGKLLWQML